MNKHIPRNRKPGPRHPAGSKVARRFAKHRRHVWDGAVFHSGELTKLNQDRARKRLGLPPIPATPRA